MTHDEAQQEALARGLGKIHFQFNIAQNTGRAFEVGYINRDGERVLFCKRQSSSSEDAFYLCNEFREEAS